MLPQDFPFRPGAPRVLLTCEEIGRAHEGNQWRDLKPEEWVGSVISRTPEITSPTMLQSRNFGDNSGGLDRGSDGCRQTWIYANTWALLGTRQTSIPQPHLPCWRWWPISKRALEDACWTHPGFS